MPMFWRVLIINGCWILSKAFYASIEIIIWFLSFNLLIWCITLIDLSIMKIPCISGMNPNWSWCVSILKCCWTLFAKILLKFCNWVEDFCIWVHQWYWPVVFFFCVVFGFGIRVMWPCRMSSEVFLPLQFFEEL